LRICFPEGMSVFAPDGKIEMGKSFITT
jgi:hypothetical protein